MCKESIKANSNFFLYYIRRKLSVKGSVNSPGIEETLKDIKAITEKNNFFFFTSVFTIAFLYM